MQKIAKPVRRQSDERSFSGPHRKFINIVGGLSELSSVAATDRMDSHMSYVQTTRITLLDKGIKDRVNILQVRLGEMRKLVETSSQLDELTSLRKADLTGPMKC